MKHFTIREILNNASYLAPLESQREYRMRIASFIRMHTLRVEAIEKGEDPKSLPYISMLVIADTGCGKTYVASQIAKASGVNFITVDCSSLSRTGWRGMSLGQVLLQAQKNCEASDFSSSIVLFDEFDKLRLHFGEHDEGNPQFNFLTLFEGAVTAETTEHVGDSPTIDTSRMSFIFAGAFADNDLKKIVRKRVIPANTVGFASSGSETKEAVDPSHILSQTKMQDIKQYGILEELCGRISSIYYLPPLNLNDYRILIKGKKGSMLSKYRNLFNQMGVDIDITDDACDMLATAASNNTLGARSVNPELFERFNGCIDVVELDTSITKVVIDVDGGALKTVFERDRSKLPRVPVTSVDLYTKTRETPDVSLYHYIKNAEDVIAIRDFAIQMYKLTNHEHITLISVFLDVAIYYLKRNCMETDCTLEGVEKLAAVTKMSKDRPCTFEVMVEKSLNAASERDPYKKHMSEFFEVYLEFVTEDPSNILLSAVRTIRRNWYSHLNRSVG